MTLLFGSAADAQVSNLGASGAIAAVLGAYFVLYPGSHIKTRRLRVRVRRRQGARPRGADRPQGGTVFLGPPD
jgi:membrane associated rhomboid family serine protease